MTLHTHSEAFAIQPEAGSDITDQPTPDAPFVGLLSGPALQEQLEQTWQRARALNRPFGVMFLRALNRGDLGPTQHTLASLAELHASARVGFYDRQALIVVLPDADAHSALQIARTLGVRLSGRGRVACGIAVYPTAGRTLSRLVGAAERAARRASSLEPVVTAPAVPCVRSAMLMSGSESALESASAAPSAQPTLVLGEAGSGKEYLARELHSRSARRDLPFKVIQCAAVPQADFERTLLEEASAAQSGTLFLDDVAELELVSQAALLRVLEARQLAGATGTSNGLHFIAASDRDLDALCAQGSFLVELRQQFEASPQQTAPLRARPDELLSLAEHFAAAISARWGASPVRLSEDAQALLRGHTWPGNLSELRSVIERAVMLAEDDTVTAIELPEYIRYSLGNAPSHTPISAANGGPILDLRASLHDHEAMLIRQALQLSGGNQRKAATLLRLPLRTFERKLRNLGGRERLMAS